MREYKRLAYAKINIGLEVLGKRDDGYHNINTLMSLINLADELEFYPSSSVEVLCPQYSELNTKDNIIYKTINEIKKRYFLVDKGIKIKLNKKIPIGAGLGGGSSDSAATIKTLNDVWYIGITNPNMKEIAIKIGSDVPFFLKNKSAIVQGKGDIIRHFQYVIPYYIVLIYPRINISTKEAYESLNIGQTIKTPTDYLSLIKLSQKAPYILKEFFKNDFENVIFPKYPILKDIKETLYEFGALFSLMSGSGSSIYGFFEKQLEAELAVSQFPEFDCFLCKGI